MACQMKMKMKIRVRILDKKIQETGPFQFPVSSSTVPAGSSSARWTFGAAGSIFIFCGTL
jgi:hypothetical protein